MKLPAGLMPCLSSSPFSALKESIRASKAESQVAPPLTMTTFLAGNTISSPKGSAVWTEGGAAGLCSADGDGDAEGLAAGAGLAAGVGAGAGLAAGLAVTAGAGEAPAPSPVGAWA